MNSPSVPLLFSLLNKGLFFFKWGDISDSAGLIWFWCVYNGSGGVTGVPGSMYKTVYRCLFLLVLSSHISTIRAVWTSPKCTIDAFTHAPRHLVYITGLGSVNTEEKSRNQQKEWKKKCHGELKVNIDQTDRWTRYKILFGGWSSGMSNTTKHVEWRNATEAVKLRAAGFGRVQKSGLV